MRYRNLLWGGAAVLAGALLGSLVGPQPVEAVAKEIIDIQNDVGLLLQGQRSMQNSVDQNQGVVKTMLQQTLDSSNRLSTLMGAMQKSVQDAQANAGSRFDNLTGSVQAISDNIADVNAHIGKLNQQLVDLQSSIQSIDAKLAASAPPPPAAAASGAPGAPVSQPAASPSMPAADVLYSSAYRDITAGNYDLSKQEFQEYIKYYPGTELASNAQFYLGEIAALKKNYRDAIAQYNKVIQNYPNSFKIPSARVKKGLALLALGQKTAGVRELREVIRDYPDSDEARLASSKLRQIGASKSSESR
ncbi:MAG: tol-pal system protein YbgF [Candidatus Acidiferrum sp.]